MSEKPKAAPQKKEKKGGGGKFVLWMVFLGCLVPFGLPTLVVCMGFLPTLVALLTDTDRRQSGVATIGYMNLAGVCPFIVELWEKGQTMPAALGIIQRPFTWAVMLGAAGMGHLILYSIPYAMASFVLNRQAARLRKLREGLKELESIWGPDVGTEVSLETVRQRKGAL